MSLHHDRDESRGLARNLERRCVLRMADESVAGIAARSSRPGLSAIGAAKQNGDRLSSVKRPAGAAMTAGTRLLPSGHVRSPGQRRDSRFCPTGHGGQHAAGGYHHQRTGCGAGHLSGAQHAGESVCHSFTGGAGQRQNPRERAGRVFKALQKLPNMV